MLNIQENISLKKYTTFEIGGEARYFVEVESLEDIEEAIVFARDKNIEFFVLAGGSNVLFSDDGFDGLIIKIAIKSMALQGGELICGAGVDLMDLLMFALENSLSGGENLTGIPGSVGGAIRGNAGAFGTEMKDIISEVHVLNVDTGDAAVMDNKKCEFEYRNSFFKKNQQYVIISCVFTFMPGEMKDIELAMYNIIAKRNSKQIQGIKSAGSFFVNPVVNEKVQKIFESDTGKKSRNGRVPAGWVLEACNLLKKRIGDVQAGIQHANYFINMDNGTAEQVMQLSALSKTRARNEFDVQLKEEVVLVGF